MLKRFWKRLDSDDYSDGILTGLTIALIVVGLGQALSLEEETKTA